MNRQLGTTNPLLIATILFAVLTVGFAGFGIWSFINYQDQKNNVDIKIADAVTVAEQLQRDKDQVAFDEQEKQPTRQIVGPADLGKVTFSYPKTWSVYIAREGSNGTYEAYFHPGEVPPLERGTQYALRANISGEKYESLLADFNDRLKSGKLKSSPVTVSGVDGIRLDGAFSDTVRGSMVLFKIRDKTLQIYTQAEVFKPDFDNYILKTLEFNK